MSFKGICQMSLSLLLIVQVCRFNYIKFDLIYENSRQQHIIQLTAEEWEDEKRLKYCEDRSTLKPKILCVETMMEKICCHYCGLTLIKQIISSSL